MFLHVKYIKEIFVKKRTLLFLSLCASALNAQLVQADMVNAPSSQVSSAQVAETGGQLSVVDEAGQIKAILSNIQGEIIGVTAQFSSETNSGITVTFSMDEQGRYVAVLDRSAFAEEDQVFSLKLTAQLTDGSFQTLSDYSFEWKKDVVSAAEKPTALDNSDATPSKIEEEATSTTTSSTVNSSLTAGATSSTSNSLTRSSSNTIAGSSNGSTSVPSARVSTASSSVNVTQPTGTITIENRNDAQGTFDVRVTNVSSPKDIASVLLPTWSQSDDIRWYEATRQSDGSYKLTVNKKDHKYRTGTYTVHLYYKDSNGGLTGAGGTTTHLSNPSAQRSYTVYIDPGHGGRDSGASYGGVHEKNLALSVSNKLRENLLQYGINVLMTRTGDYDVDFKTERSRMTNASNADLFISIHFNATGAGVSNATGIETYWYQYNPEYQPKINKEMHNNPTRLAESEILANKVQESLIKETGAVNRGVRRETFAVLRETAIPAILVELGFMDNPSELQVIKQDSYHTRLAKALAQGVMNWYGAVEGK
ncbi:hypothetical protein HO682_03390 [Streptococcus suis]|nr:hypothetical protein [Streptococcus suis]NQG82687.1 hypothetical protein [Streptococcus suis]NQG87081.1 hypothetical protein [Streptococcus suis]NQH89615.1 hypothetical protein [Streptococcus suis]